MSFYSRFFLNLGAKFSARISGKGKHRRERRVMRPRIADDDILDGELSDAIAGILKPLRA